MISPYDHIIGIDTAGRLPNLERLMAEMDAAGVPHRALGLIQTRLHTYDDQGMPVELPPSALAIVQAHVPDPVPDYGADAMDSAPAQIAQGVTQLRAYLAIAPAAVLPAQRETAFRLLIRVCLFVLRRLL